MRLTSRASGPLLVRAARLLSALALVAVACAPAAQAGVSQTPNACRFNYDGEYRTQAVEVAATAPANAVAGERFTLSGERLEVKLRPDLASDAAQTGLIPSSPAGTVSTITTKTWFALRGTNTVEGTRVIGPITVVATTTAYYDEAGQSITATPFAYTPPDLPDTTWTGGGGDVVFSQGGPGAITAALGQLPVGGGASNVTVQGSTVVQANLPDGVNFFMDCQPGQTIVTRPQAGAGTTFNPLVALPFATVAVAGAPSNPEGRPPQQPDGPTRPGDDPRATAPGRVLASRLRSSGGRVRVRISCPRTTGDCAGTARLRSATPVRLGRRPPRLVDLVRATRYRVAQGASRTVALTLSLDGRAVLRRRAAQRVRLTLRPATGRASVRTLTLRRG